MIAYISNDSSNIPSDEGSNGNRLDELDTSFFSDRQYLVTNCDQQQQQSIHNSGQIVHELTVQEALEIAEVRTIEQEAIRRRTQVRPHEEAAILIQKVWRGYKTRQILREYLIEAADQSSQKLTNPSQQESGQSFYQPEEQESNNDQDQQLGDLSES